MLIIKQQKNEVFIKYSVKAVSARLKLFRSYSIVNKGKFFQHF